MRRAVYRALTVTAIALLGCGKSESTPRKEDDPAGCDYEGSRYEDGESFEASDGCNTCTCDAGDVGCTERGCQPATSCEDMSRSYGDLVQALKACDPAAPNPCATPFTEGLTCGCTTYGITVASQAEGQLRSFQEKYTAEACGAGIQCGACNEPVGGYCNENGRCEDIEEGSPIAEAKASCVAFCEARQIHIEQCRVRDGDVALNETYESCMASAEAIQFGLCATDASCGGWLARCLTDPEGDIDLAAFLPSTTCAESVAAGVFAPRSL